MTDMLRVVRCSLEHKRAREVGKPSSNLNLATANFNPVTKY